MSIYDVFSGGNRPFDKEEWAAAKQAQRKEAYELIDNTCSEMVASGDSFRQYLDVQGRFDRYSVANAILVSAQMPEATQLKEYSKWKANRVYVNKDAQKIIILEPSKEYTRVGAPWRLSTISTGSASIPCRRRFSASTPRRSWLPPPC